MSNGSNGERLDEAEEAEERHRPLVDRLRRLRWPEAAPGVRERRLAELKEILAGRRPRPSGTETDDQS